MFLWLAKNFPTFHWRSLAHFKLTPPHYPKHFVDTKSRLTRHLSRSPCIPLLTSHIRGHRKHPLNPVRKCTPLNKPSTETGALIRSRLPVTLWVLPHHITRAKRARHRLLLQVCTHPTGCSHIYSSPHKSAPQCHCHITSAWTIAICRHH